MTRLLCLIGLHDWQRWTCVVGWHWRKCRRCGRKQNRTHSCNWRNCAMEATALHRIAGATGKLVQYLVRSIGDAVDTRTCIFCSKGIEAGPLQPGFFGNPGDYYHQNCAVRDLIADELARDRSD